MFYRTKQPVRCVSFISPHGQTKVSHNTPRPCWLSGGELIHLKTAAQLWFIAGQAIEMH